VLGGTFDDAPSSSKKDTMSHYYEPTASGFAERFRNNAHENNELSIGRDEWESLDGWTASDCRAVLEAARQNTSIRRLEVDVFRMSEKAIDVFSAMVGQLCRVEHVQVGKTRQQHAPGTGTAPTGPKILEKVLAAIATCPSDVRTFESRTCCSPRALLMVTERYPTLETIDLDGPCRRSGRGCRACSASHDFAMAFAASVGRLPSLRRVRFNWSVPHPSLPPLLASLHASATLRELALDIPVAGAADDSVVRGATLFCASTQTARALVCCRRSSSGGYGGMSSFFDIGPLASFSPTLTEMQFFRCAFLDDKPKSMLNRAAKAMRHVEFLRLGRCYFPGATKILEKMPRLRKFSCLSRAHVLQPYEPIDEGEYDSEPHVLQGNGDLEDVCRAVERQGSLLEDVELDVVSGGGESFPAIARLMGACRGVLVLNFGELPWTGAAHIVHGAARLRRDLRELRLRFAHCDFDDACFSDIFHTFGSNTSLTVLELGFDGYADLDTCALSLAAIRGLVESNDTLQTLSIRGLGRDASEGIFEHVLPVLGATNRSLRTLELHGGGNHLAESWSRACGPVLDMLNENRVLSKLEGIPIPVRDPAAHLLRQNRYGRRLLQAHDPSPMGIWAAVLARVSEGNHHEVMYAFLRAKPGLVRSSRALPALGRSTRKRARGGR
jgi:hypothetical protein